MQKVLLLEPFFSGSHQQWAEGLQKHSRHEIKILSLKGRHWKWRMYGGAVALAEQFNRNSDGSPSSFKPDLILATDMLDLTTFLALTRNKSTGIPTAIYFHENQITYPWSPSDADVKLGRNNQYGFINYTSALAADHIYFNSHFHKNAFLNTLPKFLSQFPDHKGINNVEKIKNKSSVLHLGLDLKRFDKYKLSAAKPRTGFGDDIPTLLWNHRWEYDKNPDAFFNTLFQLKDKGIKFKLIVLGESYKNSPPIFKNAKKALINEIIHFGYADTFEQYATLLWQADISPVTSRQDFFGGSVVEAMYCGSIPILPKRLAYPEHLPEEAHGFYFYEKEEEFLKLLEEKINDINNGSKFNGGEHMGKYDWGRLIEKYDNIFQNLIY